MSAVLSLFVFCLSCFFSLGCNVPKAEQYADGQPLEEGLADLHKRMSSKAASGLCNWGQKLASLSNNDRIMTIHQLWFVGAQFSRKEASLSLNH